MIIPDRRIRWFTLLLLALGTETGLATRATTHPDLISIGCHTYAVRISPLYDVYGSQKSQRTRAASALNEASGARDNFYAKWKLRDGSLFLSRILKKRHYKDSTDREIPISSVVPEAEGEVFAKWFNGQLILVFENAHAIEQVSSLLDLGWGRLSSFQTNKHDQANLEFKNGILVASAQQKPESNITLQRDTCSTASLLHKRP